MRLIYFAIHTVGFLVAAADRYRAWRAWLLFHLTTEAVAEQTVIRMTFADGTGRTFRYPQILARRRVDTILDHLIDEMAGMPVDAPIEVQRYFEGGQVVVDRVGMYSLEE